MRRGKDKDMENEDAPAHVYPKTEKGRRELKDRSGELVSGGRWRRESLAGAKADAFSRFH